MRINVQHILEKFNNTLIDPLFVPPLACIYFWLVPALRHGNCYLLQRRKAATKYRILDGVNLLQIA